MKIIHTADIHLTTEDEERFSTLSNIIKVANEKKCDGIIIAGDLFDKGKSSPELRKRVRDIFSSTESKIFLLPGNHDYDSYTFDTNYGDNAIMLSEKPVATYDFNNIKIVGVPHQDESLSSIIQQSNAKGDILIIHGALYSDWMESFEQEEENKMTFFISDIPKNFSYIALGHYHSKCIIKKTNDLSYVVYPGSPCSITKKEIGKRRIIFFEIEKDKGVSNIEEITISSPFWIEKEFISIPGYEDILLTEIKEWIKEQSISDSENKKLNIILNGYTNFTEMKIKEIIEDIIKKYNEIFNLIDIDNNVVSYKELDKSFIKKFMTKVYERLKNEPEKKDIYFKTMKLFISKLEDM